MLRITGLPGQKVGEEKHMTVAKIYFIMFGTDSVAIWMLKV
jgi:hypothetical protein